MRVLFVLFSLLLISPSAADESASLVVKASAHGVSETIDRLAGILEKRGITIFARVDHAAGAAKVGQTLKPTQLLIFGNPKLGTPLMTANIHIGLDLPMKALAWEDDAGKVWLGYVKPDALKMRHGISGRDEVFAKMTGALDKLTTAATAP